MAMIVTDIKDLLKINIKARHDDISDQYSRIFMMKLFLICSVVTGISWYTDKMHCVIPGFDPESPGFPAFSAFVVSTCWIQGVYVYQELNKRNDDLAYFGITRDIDLDGVYNDKTLCKSYNRLDHTVNEGCIPMTKTFYQQYQYTPFLLAALAIVFYIPYIIDRTANHDMINLDKASKKDKVTAKTIHQVYFDGRTLGMFKSKHVHSNVWHYIVIMLVKVLYIIVNLAVFFILAYIYGSKFYEFGPVWWKWNQLDNSQRYDYMGSSTFPKPANEILPPFGYCEVHTSAKDVRETEVDKLKVICEISQHVLYQYTLILLWFSTLIGVVVSFLGCIYKFIKFIEKVTGFRKFGEGKWNRMVIESLSYRQIEYIDYLKKHNICLYGEVMLILRGEVGTEEHDDSDKPNGYDVSITAETKLV